MDGVTQRVLHYKNQLETSKESKKIDHVFNRLEEMLVTVAVLQSTGIGKVVNGFRKHEGSIGRKAKAIVSRWKTMVAQEAMRLDAEREANDTGSNVSDNDVSSNKSYSQHSDCSDNMSSQESSYIDEKRDTSDEDYYQTKDRDSYIHNTQSLKDPENKYRTSNKHSHSEIRDTKSHKTYNTCNGLNSDSYPGGHNHSDKRRSSKTDTSCKDSGSKSDKSDQRSSSHRDRDTAKHSSKNSKVDSTLGDKSSRDKGSGSHQSGNRNSHSSSSSKDDRSHRDDQLSDQDQSDAGKHSTKRGMSENKHREKDKHREDKHREDKHRGKDRHSEKSKHSEKEKYSEKDKYSEIDKHIEKDKQKHIEKEKHREKEKHKEKEKHSEKEKNKHRENKEKEKHTEKEKDKHRNKERDREKEKQKEKQREKGKHGEKDKHHVDSNTDQKDRNKLVYHDDIVESDSRLPPSITCRKFVDDEDEESPGHMFFDHHSSASQMDYSELSSDHVDGLQYSGLSPDHVDGLRYSGLSPDHADSPQYSGLSPENESTRKDDSVHELPDLPAQSKNSTNHHKNSHSSKSGDRHKSHSSGQRSGQGHNSKHSGSHESSSSRSSKHSSSHSKSSEKLSSNKHSSKASSKSEAKKESDSQSKTYSEDKNSHKSDRKHSDKSHSKTSSKDSKPNKEKKRKSDHHSKEESSSKKSRRSSQQELGLSFADCLDLDSTTSSGKAKSKSDYEKLKSKFKIKKKGSLGDAMAREKSSPSSSLPPLKRKIEEGNLSDSSPTKQMNLSSRDISGTLPEISTSYRPWRVNPLEEKKKVADTTSDFDESLIGTKNYTRTQVYSGKKQVTVPELYSLQEICLRVLCNNIDNLENVGGVPYYILKPVLERCTAIQLYRIEDFNPQFVAETDMLWKSHCQKDFKGAQAEEFESWRELYIRKYDEREARLKSVRSNITASIAKAQPVRTAKLAYVDSAAKPPREVRRQQLKYGTAGPTTGERSKKYDKFATAMDPIAINREKREERNVKQKAPMMQKTLKMIKKIRR